MITQKVISSIYKKYKRRPKSVDELNVGLLFSPAMDEQTLFIDGDTLHIGSLPDNSPFSVIPLTRVHAILDFEKYVGIVLHSSIIFLKKNSDKVDVHVNLEGPSLIDRLRMSLSSL